MKIEIWFDLVCPFCYIGKKRFEKALNEFSHKDKVEVIYRSYELNPTIANEGNPKHTDSLMSKYHMTKEEVEEMLTELVDQAKELGLDYNFDIAIPTNTMDAHRLVHYSNAIQKPLVIESLYKAHFTDGLNIGNHKVLMELASKLGLDKVEIMEMLESNQFHDNVIDDELKARLVGVTGVPFFVINEEYWISGAQPSETFLQAIEEVWQENNLNNNLSGNVCTDDVCDFES